MPTLRFSRDRRGYESTYLLHAARQRSGPDQPQLLYWFRSPPHVKIGRAAFDEDAIRLLEEQHPDVEFDWDRLLTTKPPAAPEPRDPREPRPGRRPERRPVKEGRREAPRAWQAEPPTAPAPPVDQAPPEVQTPPPAALTAEPAPSAIEPVFAPVPEPAPIRPATVEATATPSRRFVRVFDAPVHTAGTPEHHASELSAVERMLGAEQLTMLRARHAEILARISARGGDPARVEALREQAAAVDPDGWVTEADVTAGLASVDTTLAELHRIVGRRRRRRRRRRVEGSVAPPAGDAGGASAGERLDQADADDELELDADADGPPDD